MNAPLPLTEKHLQLPTYSAFLPPAPQNWRAQGQLVDSLVKQYEAEIAETKKQIASVNLERKLEQTAAGVVMFKWGRTSELRVIRGVEHVMDKQQGGHEGENPVQSWIQADYARPCIQADDSHVRTDRPFVLYMQGVNSARQRPSTMSSCTRACRSSWHAIS